MVYTFECADCQVRVYSASPKRARGCPLCERAMTAHPHPAPTRGRAAKPPGPQSPLRAASPSIAPPSTG